MEHNLQYQQSQAWNLYKTWGTNHTATKNDHKEIGLLNERLNGLLKEDETNKPAFNPTPPMKFVEKDLNAVICFIADVVGPEKIFCLS